MTAPSSSAWRPSGREPIRTRQATTTRDIPELPDVEGLRRVVGSVLRSSSRVGHVPDHPSWLTGHREEHDSRCPRCSTPLSRSKVAERSTVCCPRCQPS
ncbi:zinc finger domain-containing protein [Saccharopolyspora sp. NPDC049357]|uniref:zinc finger domain-containing protein n=1 Tax=Saccharopolyspora sp. NPDC049357 TaxID=3154507 RepID=UPI00341C84B1